MAKYIPPSERHQHTQLSQNSHLKRLKGNTLAELNAQIKRNMVYNQNLNDKLFKPNNHSTHTSPHLKINSKNNSKYHTLETPSTQHSNGPHITTNSNNNNKYDTLAASSIQYPNSKTFHNKDTSILPRENDKKLIKKSKKKLGDNLFGFINTVYTPPHIDTLQNYVVTEDPPTSPSTNPPNKEISHTHPKETPSFADPNTPILDATLSHDLATANELNQIGKKLNQNKIPQKRTYHTETKSNNTNVTPATQRSDFTNTERTKLHSAPKSHSTPKSPFYTKVAVSIAVTTKWKPQKTHQTVPHSTYIQLSLRSKLLSQICSLMIYLLLVVMYYDILSASSNAKTLPNDAETDENILKSNMKSETIYSALSVSKSITNANKLSLDGNNNIDENINGNTLLLPTLQLYSSIVHFLSFFFHQNPFVIIIFILFIRLIYKNLHFYEKIKL